MDNLIKIHTTTIKKVEHPKPVNTLETCSNQLEQDTALD